MVYTFCYQLVSLFNSLIGHSSVITALIILFQLPNQPFQVKDQEKCVPVIPTQYVGVFHIILVQQEVPKRMFHGPVNFAEATTT